MASEIPQSTNYSGRQLDLECLQTMRYPSTAFVEVVPSVTFDTPKIVSGPQKLVQRYAVLFTTTIGSDVMDPAFGTELLGRLDHGNFGGYLQIELMANIANSQAASALKEDDADSARFGVVPDDEKLESSWIDRVVVDKDNRKIDIHVCIRTVAGENITFVVPTEAGIY